MDTLTITVDGENVTLSGTTKGDAAQRAAITRPWVWGGRAQAWVLPRNLRPDTRARAIRTVTAALKAAGYDVEVERVAEEPSEAERRAAATERLEARAERYEATSTRLAGEAERRWAASDRLQAAIPFGQPVLVGHHSQRRHERDLERIRSDFDKGMNAHRTSQQLADRAEGIRRELAGTPLVTLRRRIERQEAEVRDLDRKIDGTGASIYARPAEGEYREQLLALKARTAEALDLDRAELGRREAEDGVKVWTRADFVKGDEVASSHGWSPVLRVNARTVTIPHIIDQLAEYGHTWTLPYAEVRGCRRDGEVTLTRQPAAPQPAPSGGEALAAIVDDLAQPETCTCGTTAGNAVGMEAHLATDHGMGPDAYPAPAAGDRFVWASTARTPGAPGYPERSGQPVEVLRPLDASTYDAAEVGPMFLVRFADGVETDAFGDELRQPVQP